MRARAEECARRRWETPTDRNLVWRRRRGALLAHVSPASSHLFPSQRVARRASTQTPANEHVRLEPRRGISARRRRRRRRRLEPRRRRRRRRRRLAAVRRRVGRSTRRRRLLRRGRRLQQHPPWGLAVPRRVRERVRVEDELLPMRHAEAGRRRRRGASLRARAIAPPPRGRSIRESVRSRRSSREPTREGRFYPTNPPIGRIADASSLLSLPSSLPSSGRRRIQPRRRRLRQRRRRRLGRRRLPRRVRVQRPPQRRPHAEARGLELPRRVRARLRVQVQLLPLRRAQAGRRGRGVRRTPGPRRLRPRRPAPGRSAAAGHLRGRVPQLGQERARARGQPHARAAVISATG